MESLHTLDLERAALEQKYVDNFVYFRKMGFLKDVWEKDLVAKSIRYNTNKRKVLEKTNSLTERQLKDIEEITMHRMKDVGKQILNPPDYEFQQTKLKLTKEYIRNKSKLLPKLWGKFKDLASDIRNLSKARDSFIKFYRRNHNDSLVAIRKYLDSAKYAPDYDESIQTLKAIETFDVDLKKTNFSSIC